VDSRHTQTRRHAAAHTITQPHTAAAPSALRPAAANGAARAWAFSFFFFFFLFSFLFSGRKAAAGQLNQRDCGHGQGPWLKLRAEKGRN
jgi:hypothetical protein